jgi:UDP-GlcNAc:undecaprenyl-phosphate GlcNAc-1-phosphate transferase
MRLDIPHPAILAAFALLTVVWYWLSSRRERALKFFRAIRRWPVFGAERPRADVDAEPANLPRRPRS